jgi:hypothetical protein
LPRLSSRPVDFAASRLRLKLPDAWYKLGETQQNELAQQLWQRSQRFDFRKLEIQDAHNHLIARSPIVGNDMVVLRRTA